MFNWPNGLGSSLGDVLGTCKPLSLSGAVWFVSSLTGSDSYNGGDQARPLATLAAAYTAAAGGDIIVLLSGHSETLTAQQTLGKAGLTIVGLGNSGGLPTVKFQMNAAAATMMNVTGAATALRNIWFQANKQANSAGMLTVSGAGFRMSDCYMELDKYDAAAGLTFSTGGDTARIINSTFVNIAAASSAVPLTAIQVNNALSDFEMSGVVLDAGTAGFSDYYAADLSAAAITRLRGESVTLKNGADIRLHASTTGYLNAQTVTGAGKVFW